MSKEKPTKTTTTTNGSDLHIGIVASRYNNDLVEVLIRDVRAELRKSKVAESAIKILRVPGAGEIPYVANMLAMTDEYDCIIALGVIIKGDTIHDEVLSKTIASALQTVAIKNEVPVINGVISAPSPEAAAERVTGARARGAEFAAGALEMAWHRILLGDYLDELFDKMEEEDTADMDYFEYEKKLYAEEDDEGEDDDNDTYPFHKN